MDEKLDLTIVEVSEDVDIPEKVPFNNPKDNSLNNSKYVTLNNPKDISVNNPKDVPLNDPKNIPVNNTKDITLNDPKDIPINIPNDIPLNNPKDVPLNNPKDVPLNNPKDIPFNNQKDIPLNNHKDISLNNPKDIPVNNLSDIPLNNLKDIPFNNPNDIPFNNRKHFPLNNQKDIRLNNQKDVPLNNPEDIPLNNPKNISLNDPRDISINSGESTQPKKIKIEGKDSSKVQTAISSCPKNLNPHPTKKPRNLVSENLERMNFLLQVSRMTTECSVKTANNYSNISSLSGSLAMSIGRKCVLRMLPEIKRQFCKGCGLALVPGLNAKCRIKRKRQQQLNMTCMSCRTLKRFATNPNHILRVEQERLDDLESKS